MKKTTAVAAGGELIPTVKQFLKAFNERLKGIEDSCKELARMADDDPDVFDKIIAEDRRFNHNMLGSMRRVGKGELYSELLFDSSMAARKLLPLTAGQQKKLYNEPVKIVKLINGKHVIEEKSLQKLSRHELTLVIDEENKRTRTVEEQIAFVKPPPAKRAQRFEIKGDKVEFLANTICDANLLRSILAQMESTAIGSLGSTMKGNQLKS